MRDCARLPCLGWLLVPSWLHRISHPQAGESAHGGRLSLPTCRAGTFCGFTLPPCWPSPQEVTDQIRQKTGHLPGVSIAVMGCIVNGPGEMADADFG